LLFYHWFHFSGPFWGPGRYGRYQQMLETFVCVGSHLDSPALLRPDKKRVFKTKVLGQPI
jgi:hypothetical protein